MLSFNIRLLHLYDPLYRVRFHNQLFFLYVITSTLNYYGDFLRWNGIKQEVIRSPVVGPEVVHRGRRPQYVWRVIEGLQNENLNPFFLEILLVEF